MVDATDPEVARKIMYNYEARWFETDDVDLRNFDADTGGIGKNGEAMSVENAYFGDERLKASLVRHSGAPLPEMAEEILEEDERGVDRPQEREREGPGDPLPDRPAARVPLPHPLLHGEEGVRGGLPAPARGRPRPLRRVPPHITGIYLRRCCVASRASSGPAGSRGRISTREKSSGRTRGRRRWRSSRTPGT